MLKDRVNINTICVGQSFLHDINGNSYRVSDLTDLLKDGYLEVNGFDKESWKTKKVRIIKFKEGDVSNLIKIKTSNSWIEISGDSFVYINKNGDLKKVLAKDVIAGDLLLIPKSLSFPKKNFQIEDIFPNKKGSVIKTRVGNKIHQANADMSISFLSDLGFLSGLLDACGCYNIISGDIIFSTENNIVNSIFAHLVSSCFLVEPQIDGNLVRIKNKSVAMLIDGFLKVIASQNEEIVVNYLSGYFHAYNSFGFVDKAENKPFISLCYSGTLASDRLCKCLLLYGIVPFRSSKSYLITDYEHVKLFFSLIPYLIKSLAIDVNNYFCKLANKSSPVFGSLGYKFGNSILNIKNNCGITCENYKKIMIFEQEDIIMNYFFASKLNNFIKKKNKTSSFSKLIDSSVVGIKVFDTKSVESKTFTIGFDSDCGIFLNNILCAC